MWVAVVAMGAALSQPACSSEVQTRGNTGGGGSGGSASGGGGQTSACSADDCTAELGEPAICVDGACVALASATCDRWIGDPSRDDAVWLGMIAPLSQFEVIGEELVAAVELQNLEVIETTGSDHRGAYNVLVCDGETDVDAGLDHLIDDVGVPAIIGPAFSSRVLDVWPRITAAGTLLLSPSATSPEITTLEDEGLVWRTAAPDSESHKPLVGLTSELEARVRLTLGVPSTDPIRVAIVHTDSPFPNGIYEPFSAAAVVNGQSLFENGPNVLDLELSQGTGDHSDAITTLAQFAPHIVVGIGEFDEMVTSIAIGLEAALNASAPNPSYALTEITLGAATAAPLSLRQRLTGVAATWTGPLYQSFSLRFQAHNGQPASLGFAANAYDAGLLLAFALRDGNADSGAALAARLATMTSGPTVEAAPAGLAAGMNLAAMGAPFDYDGASGPVDFDPVTGDVRGWWEAWCFDAAGDVQTAPYFDPNVDAVTGMIACP